MAGTTGLEPAASAVTGQRSNQLNYVPSLFFIGLADNPVTCTASADFLLLCKDAKTVYQEELNLRVEPVTPSGKKIEFIHGNCLVSFPGL